jgi:hypothetical protein
MAWAEPFASGLPRPPAELRDASGFLSAADELAWLDADGVGAGVLMSAQQVDGAAVASVGPAKSKDDEPIRTRRGGQQGQDR